MKDINQRHKLELSDILEEGMVEYVQSHHLHPVQEKAVKDIIACRSNKLGGHTNMCNSCGYTQQAYNSCRNRHCPKCQYVKQEQWVDKLAHNLLPCKYFHVVFTIPQELHNTLYLNPKNGYNLLFKAATQALTKAAANPDFLGAQSGALAVLHTWTQTLCYHPHIHMLVPAGGLSEDEMEWVTSGKKFFLPQKALARIFRGVFIKMLKQCIGDKNIKLPDNISDFDVLNQQLYAKEWNVFIKKPFRGPSAVLTYLGRYTHKVAISNSRLLNFEKGKVSFRYKDNRNHGKQKVMVLDIQEFIRRYLQHILPDNFYKIRYIGILANINIKAKREKCIELIGSEMNLPKLQGLTGIEVMEISLKKDIFKCPNCSDGRLYLLPKEAG